MTYDVSLDLFANLATFYPNVLADIEMCITKIPILIWIRYCQGLFE